MLCPPSCLCRADVAWSVRSGGLLAASLSRSALLGLLRPFALRCRAVVVGAPLLALRSFYSVLPRASARRQKTKQRRRTTTPDQGLAAARPLSAALAASVGVSAFGPGLKPCPPAGSPSLRPSVAFLVSAPCIHYTINVCSFLVYLIRFVISGG